MKMFKKSISLFTIAAMTVGTLVGCGSSSNTATEAATTETEAVAGGGTVESAEVTGDVETVDLSAQEPYTVRVVADGFGSEEACAEISAAISEITKAKFNTTVEITRYDFGTY